MSNQLISASDLQCLDSSENYGKKLYKHNENYKNIANVMEHPEFRKFLKLYFSDPDKIKFILLFLNLYEDIERNSPIELNGYQKIAILDKLIKNSDFRQQLCYNNAI